MAAWASRQAVKRVHAVLARRAIDGDAIRDALLEADRDVGRGIARRTARSGATTMALCAGTSTFLPRWYIGWVGDCRIYRLSSTGQTVELLTRDDTYRNLGERPPPDGSPDDPARMVGNGAVGNPNVDRVDLRFGETLLLCSDGVYKHVSSDEIVGAFAAESPLAQRCMRLLEVARSHGSVDDATALVVRRERRPRSALRRYAFASALLLLLYVVFLAFATHAEASPAGSTSVTSLLLHVHSEYL
jgi:protein phosphatase